MRLEISDREVIESRWWDFHGFLLGQVKFKDPSLRRWYDVARETTVFTWDDK